MDVYGDVYVKEIYRKYIENTEERYRGKGEMICLVEGGGGSVVGRVVRVIYFC